jgi:hypothetical protein
MATTGTIFFVTILLKNLWVFAGDFVLEVINVFTPKRKKGDVTPYGSPGARGKWPQYVPPREGDSRSACPGLNAMANHGEFIRGSICILVSSLVIYSLFWPGILPHDGRNIRFSELTAKVDDTFNFAPTISFFLANLGASMLQRNYMTDTFDLAELDLHNGIEHDASLTRAYQFVRPF